MKDHQISFARAHELLSYDPITGDFFWKVSQGKSKVGKMTGTVQAGYRKCTIDKEQIRMHRLAWFMSYGCWPKGQIDHIDGNKLNNAIVNLRDVPMSINMQNRYARRRKAGDLPQGVTRNISGKFVANIRIGIYLTVEEAADAYMSAKRLIHEGCTR